MYEAFDSFLKRETWHTNHDLDRKAFFQVLSRIVKDPKFNPDEMGNYITQQVNAVFKPYIDRYVSMAWAVKDYLAAIAEARGNIDRAELITKPPSGRA